MSHNGQEFGEEHPLPEDDHGTGRRVIPRPLRWKLVNDRCRRDLLRLYAQLARAAGATHPGLRSEQHLPPPVEDWANADATRRAPASTRREQLVIYHRWGKGHHGETQTFVVVLNFSEREQWASVPFPQDGHWVDWPSDYAGNWRPEVKAGRLEFSVGPHWGHVFFKLTRRFTGRAERRRP